MRDDVREAGHVELNGTTGPSIDLIELFLGSHEAYAETFCFTDPAFAVRLGNSGSKVVAYLDEPETLCGINTQYRAPDATVFMLAAGAVGAAAFAEGEFAALEVSEKLIPFGICRGAVLLARAEGTSARDEGAVTVDRFPPGRWLCIPWLC